MSELTCLELSVVLWLVHVVLQAVTGNVALPFGYLFTSRDKLIIRPGDEGAGELRREPCAVRRVGSCADRDAARRRPRRDDLDSGAHCLHPALFV